MLFLFSTALEGLPSRAPPVGLLKATWTVSSPSVAASSRIGMGKVEGDGGFGIEGDQQVVAQDRWR